MLPNAITIAGEEGCLVQATGAGRGKEFDFVAFPRRNRIAVSRSERAEIGPLLETAQAAMGVALAPEHVVARVIATHPDSLWTFRRAGQLVGGFALLMLNADGLAALLADTLDLRNPPSQLLAEPSVAPAAIYNWAVLGPATAAEGIARVIVRLQAPPYDRADLYGHPVTEHGLRLMLSLGFRPIPRHPQRLLRYVRICNRTSYVRLGNRPNQPETSHERV